MPVNPTGGSIGIFQQAGDGHGADAARDGGYGGGYAFATFKIDIADQFGFAIGQGDAVNADVDHHGALI